MLNGEDAIHAFQAEAALAVQEVRDVGLLETRLLCQAEAGEVAFRDALPKCTAEVILQNSELHNNRECSMGYSNALIPICFPQPISITNLTPKIGSYTRAYNSLCFWRSV